MRFLFGEFVVDMGTRELLRAGNPVSISPKGFQLLALLVEKRPNALSKTELKDRLWPKTHVLEANLTNLVADVRAALDDDSRQPRFIRTVHRYGWAFCADAKTSLPHAPIGRPGWRLMWRGGGAALDDGEHVLGRDETLDVCLDFPTISRRHAMFRITGSLATVEDLGSKNGTFVNGRHVARAIQVTDGDEIRLGSVRLRLRLGRGYSSTAPAPSVE